MKDFLEKIDDKLMDTKWYPPLYRFYAWRIKFFPRWVERKIYQVRHGFDPSDTWGLYATLSEWVLPRLKYLKENTHGYPVAMHEDKNEDISSEEASDKAAKKWDNIMGKMILAFELILKDDDCSDYFLCEHPEDYKAVEEGLALFAKHFMSLWD